MKDHPKRKTLNVMITQLKESHDESRTYMGSLQLLNTIKVTLLNGIQTKMFVDIGASHYFISVKEAQRLDIETCKNGGFVKIMNSIVKPI